MTMEPGWMPLLFVVAVAACSSDGAGDGLVNRGGVRAPECSALAERPVTAADLKSSCWNGDELAIIGVYDCIDGSQLIWNDFGWGFVGEPMTKHADGAELVAPEQERSQCLPDPSMP